MFSFNMVTPLVAEYVEYLGGSTTLAGLIAGMFSFFALGYRPFIGALADRIDVVKLLVVGSIIGAVSIAGYGLATESWMVACFRVTHAFALCVQTTLITVIAINYIPNSRIAESVGYVGVAAMIGMSLGPSFGVMIAHRYDHSVAFFFAAVFMVIAAITVLSLPRVITHKTRQKVSFSLEGLLDVKSLPLTVSTASFAYCAGLTTSFLVLIGSNRGIEEIALFYFVSSVGMVIVRPIAGRYADKKGISFLCVVAFCSEAVCMLVIAFANGIILVLMASIFRSFGQGIGQAVLQGQVLRDSSEEERGKASSTFYIGVDVGQGGGAIIGGAIADIFGFGVAMVSALPALLVGAAAFAFWLNHRKMTAGDRVELKNFR